MRRGLRRWGKRLSFGLAAIAVLGVAALVWPMQTGRFLALEPSPELLDRTGQPLYVFLSGQEQWCLQRDLTQISPWLVKATVAAEDQRFWDHHGVDPVAAGRAAVQNLRGRAVISGASTLSMQVVKLSGMDSGSWLGKARQALTAVRLDLRVPKEQILTAYLNKAPYGLNLVGCEAAARRYYGKPAAELTLPEAALIAALPKAPTSLMPLRSPDRARARRDYVLRRMREEGAITQAECDEATGARLGVAWHEFPQEAPHLAMRLKAGLGSVRSTLDRQIQGLAQSALSRHVAAMEGEVNSGAVLVMDTETGQVLAHVGSPDFFNAAHAGQFDATAARRSPGSTLKPFVYGLALERQCLYPGEVLLDDTLDLGRYNPKNFDLNYHGLVRADVALAASLNVPAVMILERVGVEQALPLLRAMGLSTLDQPIGAYGLGLALGDCEARLDELTVAYATVASLGQLRSAQWRLDGTPPVEPAQGPLSPGACLCMMNALRQPLPTESDRGAMAALGVLTPCAWKTGTSTGNRDAWAFVINAHYVVGVWLGNHDGRASKRLVGAKAALPLAALIFRGLPSRATPAWPSAEGVLKPVTVCALSGLPATPWCRHQRVDQVPRGLYLNRRCDVHWPLTEDGECRVVERWPGSARNWDMAGIDAPVFIDPPAGPSENSVGGEPSRVRTLQIQTPAPNAEFVLTGAAEGDRIGLRATSGEPVAWFLDDRYLGTGSTQAPCYWKLISGQHKLVAVDPAGQIATAQFRVSRP